jgi:rRNA maturation RNase YbeY
LKVNIFNRYQSSSVDEKKVRKLITYVTKTEKCHLNTLNIIIADDRYLTELNKSYLSRNHPTNVIAFDLGDVSEIYVSRDQVKQDYDLYYFITHGLLHIIGYDHDTEAKERTMMHKCTTYVESVQ